MTFKIKSTATLLVFVLLAAPFALASPVQEAQPEDVGLSTERLQRIYELVDRHLEAESFAGAVTLVARHGHIAHFEAHGLMDLETRKPMAKDAIFRIMSMTKPVVGVAVLMLMEEGKVRLNDPVSRFIPEFRDLKVAVVQQGPAGAGADPQFYTVPADRQITVRDLLTHTSGLVSGAVSNREAQRAGGIQPNDTLATYLPRLATVPLEFQPGSRWAYSAAAGFDALARVVEVASGQTFVQFAQERIFEPLGMADTFFYAADPPDSRIATLYRRTDNGLEKQQDPNFMNGTYLSGGGGLFSTAEDYLQFGQMLVNGGELNGKRLLSPRTVELMSSVHAPDTLPGRPAGEGYGLSVRVINDSIQRLTSLSDGAFGWSGAYGTHFWVDPKEKVVGILMTQTANQQIRPDLENAVMQAIVE